MVFEQFGLSEPALRGVEASGFKKPTPVQEKVIPLALEGRDLLVFAESGTGKTLSYGLPILERLARERAAAGVAPSAEDLAAAAAQAREPDSEEQEEAGEVEEEKPSSLRTGAPEAPPAPGAPKLFALILGPTRESVTRAEAALRGAGQFLGVRIRAIFGGVPAAPQREALRRGLHVVAATPGRFAEILKQQAVDLSSLRLLVLDEMDHLAQMNLMNEIRAIVDRLPTERQTLVFSGARAPEIEALSAGFLRNPNIVEVSGFRAPLEEIHQVIYPVDHTQKSDLLIDLMRALQPKKAVIFFRTRRSVDRLHSILEKLGRRVASLHADRTPAQRQAAVSVFASGEADTLVATEMAVRSLEISDISHLINFDLPHFPDDYLNRIARCSQIEPVGEVISLVSWEDRDALRRLEKNLAAPLERARLEGFPYTERGRRHIERLFAPENGAAPDTPDLAPPAASAPAPAAPAAPLLMPRPRRPAAPLPPPEPRSDGEAPGRPTRERIEISRPAPPPAASAAPPAAPPRVTFRPVAHPAESLSGRLVREAQATAAPAPASAASAPAAAKANGAPPASPRAGSPAAPSARETPPPPVPPRDLPPRRESPPRRPIAPAPALAAPAPAPPVSAAPVLPRSSSDAPPPAGAAGTKFPLATFSRPPSPEDSGALFPRGHRRPRGSRPEWIESAQEAARENLPLPPAQEEEPPEEPNGAAAEPGGEHIAPRGGRYGRGGQDRRPRKFRSWDLHRGGLLDPPPLLETPHETFLAEERAARKRESAEIARKEADAPAARAADQEPELVPAPGELLPLDWDHTIPPHPEARPSGLIKRWREKLDAIRRHAAAAPPQALPLAPPPAPPALARRPAAAKPLAPPAAASTAPSTPAWPLAADSATTVGVAPGAWWPALPVECVDVPAAPAIPEAPQKTDTKKPAAAPPENKRAEDPVTPSRQEKPAPQAASAAPRKRGRPPKNTATSTSAKGEESKSAPSGSKTPAPLPDPGKKRRGRKPTAPVANSASATGSDSPETSRRGRPKKAAPAPEKTAPAPQDQPAAQSPAPKKRGRPAANSAAEKPATSGAGKKRGRKPARQSGQ